MPIASDRQPLTRGELRLLASRFQSPWYRNYVRSKLRTDPLYPAVWQELKDSQQALLDLGCGLGLSAFFLRHCGFTPDILGIDYDEPKIDAARTIAAKHYPNTEFQHGDAREGIPDFSGNVTILDILQFFDPSQQRSLLENAARSVAPGGKLVIRSGLRDRSWRFRLTHLGDLVARATRWMKAAPSSYPTESSLRDVLQNSGLQGTVRPLWGRTPFNNYLLTFTRPLRGESPGQEVAEGGAPSPNPAEPRNS